MLDPAGGFYQVIVLPTEEQVWHNLASGPQSERVPCRIRGELAVESGRAGAGGDPGGGSLKERLATAEERAAQVERAQSLPQFSVNARAPVDLALLASGGFSPLDGFMGPGDYRSVLEELHLAGGLPWTIPVTLAVTEEQGAAVREGDEVALVAPEGLIAAVAGQAAPDSGRRNPVVVATMRMEHRS